MPSPVDEDRRQLHRGLEEMKAERTQHINRIKGLLHGVDVRLAEVNGKFTERLAELRTPDGGVILEGLRERLLREFERMQYLQQQINALERQRERLVRVGDGQAHVEKTRKLMQVRGIGQVFVTSA